MLRLIGIIISIAAADAVNPSTLVPALYIASGPAALWQVLQFGAGVLSTTLTGGLIILLGPGELILDLVPHPEPAVTDWLQTAAGIVLVISGALVWRLRGRLLRRSPPADADAPGTPKRPAFLLGAGIAAAGLPANVAYIGAITTIVGSGHSVLVQLLLLGIYDAVFILPLVSILLVLRLMPRRSAQLLGGIRRLLQTHWVTALSGVLLLAGVVVLALGLSGLATH